MKGPNFRRTRIPFLALALQHRTAGLRYRNRTGEREAKSCRSNSTNEANHQLAAVLRLPGPPATESTISFRRRTITGPRSLDQWVTAPVERVRRSVPPPVLTRTPAPVSVGPAIKPERIDEAQRIPAHICVRIESALEPDWIALDISPGGGVVIAEVVVVQIRLDVVGLTGQPQVQGVGAQACGVVLRRQLAEGSLVQRQRSWLVLFITARGAFRWSVWM